MSCGTRIKVVVAPVRVGGLSPYIALLSVNAVASVKSTTAQQYRLSLNRTVAWDNSSAVSALPDRFTTRRCITWRKSRRTGSPFATVTVGAINRSGLAAPLISIFLFWSIAAFPG